MSRSNVFAVRSLPVQTRIRIRLVEPKYMRQESAVEQNISGVGVKLPEFRIVVEANQVVDVGRNHIPKTIRAKGTRDV